MGLLNHIVALFLVLRNLRTFFKSSCTNLLFQQQWTKAPFTTSPEFISCRFSDDSHSDRCEVIPHCGFEFHFSNN